MCDAIGFWKHRAEGETNNLRAYVPDDERVKAYQGCREAIWALDIEWSASPVMKVVTNFLCLFGGPIHMTMRHYHFVEEGPLVFLSIKLVSASPARGHLEAGDTTAPLSSSLCLNENIPLVDGDSLVCRIEGRAFATAVPSNWCHAALVTIMSCAAFLRYRKHHQFAKSTK